MPIPDVNVFLGVCHSAGRPQRSQLRDCVQQHWANAEGKWRRFPQQQMLNTLIQSGLHWLKWQLLSLVPIFTGMTLCVSAIVPLSLQMFTGFSKTAVHLFQVEFSSLDFLLHTKALLSTINYLNNALPPQFTAAGDKNTKKQVEKTGQSLTGESRLFAPGSTVWAFHMHFWIH